MSYQFLSARKSNDVKIIENILTEENFGLVIIDDFHRLSEDLKKSLGDTMKLLADEENIASKLVLIGINRAGQSMMDYAPDLLHRVEVIKFGRTNTERIIELIQRGERALNCSFTALEGIADEAEGSFAMAQVLCHEACLQAGVLEQQADTSQVVASVPALRELVWRDLTATFFPAAREFATGNKLRREGRAPYLHLMMWLSKSADGNLDAREAIAANPALKGSVSQVIEKGHLETLLKSSDRLMDLIHFDRRSQLLSTEDPKFLYFIRHIVWSKFARQVGYDSVEFENTRDFALSFAGEDREIAKALCEKLQGRELHVFYDEDEAHRILGSDVEEYLAPIYRTEAKYILPLISKNYPRKVWTKFESEHFKSRFGDGSVLPIFLDDFQPSQFDIAGDVGFLRIDRNKVIVEELDRAVGALSKKIVDDRAAMAAKRVEQEDAQEPDGADSQSDGSQLQLPEL